MDLQQLFAERVGGVQFGKVNKTFKFTLIDNAKKAFLRDYPTVKLIDMGVGEPEERAADQIIERLTKAAADKKNRIYPNNGTLPFKQAAARYLERLCGVHCDPEKEILHCVGTKTALAQIPLAFLNPGDCIISTKPGYPVMPTIAGWLGAHVHAVPLHREHKFLPDLNELESIAKQERPKLLLLNYPNNPTGGIMNAEFCKAAIGLAHKYNFVIVQDAAYADFVFDSVYQSFLSHPGGKECAIELYSLSKSYNMQGYRLGFVVSNATLLSAYAVAKDNTDNGQFIAIQMAGVEALDNGAAQLNANREKYRRRLNHVSQILRDAGLDAESSPGSFYLYVPVPKTFHGLSFESAQSFTDYLINKLGVVSVPWEEAGPHIRLSMTFEVGNEHFANEDEVLSTLGARIKSGKI